MMDADVVGIFNWVLLYPRVRAMRSLLNYMGEVIFSITNRFKFGKGGFVKNLYVYVHSLTSARLQLPVVSKKVEKTYYSPQYIPGTKTVKPGNFTKQHRFSTNS